MPDNYQPLFSEILEKVGKLTTKKEKVAYLQQNNTDALRMVIKSSFDPEMNWLLPEGDVPFNRNDAQRAQSTQTCIWRQGSCIISLRVVTTTLRKVGVKTFSFKC